MKGGKHIDTKANTQRIRKLKDEEKPVAVIEYDKEEAEEEIKQRVVPKAVYFIGLALILVIIGLSVYMNRDYISVDNFVNWFRVQLMGTGTGDGYPVAVKGSHVDEVNFGHTGGDAVILSDTAFTVLNGTGRETLSVRHSFDHPSMASSGTNYLLYNAGSTGYILQLGTDTAVTGHADGDISCGAVAQDGTYALGVQSKAYASELDVYMKDGTKKYNYQFAKSYVTAVTMNPSASMGAVSTLGSDKGELISKITILDFNERTSVSEYTVRGNMVIDIKWCEDGRILAVGDSGLLCGTASDYSFTEYSYGGRTLTAYALEGNKAYVSVSGYDYIGACTIVVYDGGAEPVQAETKQRVTSLSAYAGVFGALTGGDIIFYDNRTGEELKQTPSGKDARAIALASESMAYELGISEIRMVSAQ